MVVSAASIWEASIKRAKGKLRTTDDLAAAVAAEPFEPLPISLEHAERAGSLPALHGDPFDRMLVAQAQTEDLTLVTRDRVFDSYDVPLLQA